MTDLLYQETPEVHCVTLERFHQIVFHEEEILLSPGALDFGNVRTAGHEGHRQAERCQCPRPCRNFLYVTALLRHYCIVTVAQ